MKDYSLKRASAPETEKGLEDPLTEVLRQGAKELIRKAVEAALSEMLSAYSEVRLLDGRLPVVRNGYLPARQIQTGIGEVEVQVPKVRDRSSSGIYFNSTSAFTPVNALLSINLRQ